MKKSVLNIFFKNVDFVFPPESYSPVHSTAYAWEVNIKQ